MLKTLRIYYFFLFGVNGALFPVLPLVLSRRGLTPSEIGWVMVVNPVLGTVLPPLWGIMADRYRQRERMLLFVSLLSAAAVLLLAVPVTVAGSMGAMATFCVFRSPIMSLVDATTYSALGRESTSFGKVRVWGSLGFATATMIAGFLGASTHATLLLASCSLLFVLCTLVALRFPATAPTAPSATPRPVARGTLGYALDPALMPLFVTNSLYYGAHATFDVFFMLHVKSLGRDERFASFGWGIGVLVEIMVMLFARRIFARFRSDKVLVFCGAVAVLRWFGTAEIDSPGLMLALQALHGISFGLWYLALINHVHEKVPEEARTSVQGVLAGSLSAGTAMGCLAGGRVVEVFGSVTAFRTAGVVTMIATLMYAARQRRLAPVPQPART